MALQKVDIDTPQPGGRFGDPTRTAWRKHNENLDEIELLVGNAEQSGATAVARVAELEDSLGDAAYVPAASFASAVQGTRADTAIQPAQLTVAAQGLQQQIEALATAQQTSAIYASTLADLQAVAGTFVNQGAFVLNGAGAGQYRWDGGAWQFLRADVLADKASRTEVATVAGVATTTVAGGLIEIDQDPSGKVAFAVHGDGTREFIAAKVGGMKFTRRGPDSALLSGKVSWHDVYEESAIELGGQFAGALLIEVDSMLRVGRVVWSDGTQWTAPTVGGPAVALQEMVSMPNGALAQNPNGGFTCTGLDRITTGIWRNCWLVGNHGLAVEGETGNTPSLVMLSPDMRMIVKEIPCTNAMFPGIASIQGVAWDTSDSTAWFVDKANSTIRHVDLNGTVLPDAIAVAHTPNGLAYCPAQDALYSPGEGTTQLHLISCATGTTLQTITGISEATDQCHYRPATNELWTTRGANGADGTVAVYNASTGVQLRSFTAEGSQAIEGLWTDGLTLTIVNDGAYHVNARPPLAVACKYRINA